MSLDLYVYAPEFKAGLAARVTARLADFGLVCELSPGFDFDDETHGGFLPIKMRMVSVGPESCRDTDYMIGFECGGQNSILPKSSKVCRIRPSLASLKNYWLDRRR